MLFGLFSKRHTRNLSDDELIKLVRRKDSIALGEIFQRYSPLVMGLCLKYVKNIEDAEDVMMHVFESLSEKLQKHEVQNFKSWLYSVSRNECLMEMRKRKMPTTDFEQAELYLENEAAQQLDEALLKEQELTKLENAILELKDEQKVCVELFYLQKKSYDEIHATTGFELKKVKSYIQNGKRNLKLIIEKNR